jgi:CPA2 family monovalent cation:H+ antiporter-2
MFFLSVGMLFDPSQMLVYPLLTLATHAIVMVGKPVAALVIVALRGHGSRAGLGVAVALAQIGEFSFLLAAVGRDVGVFPREMMNPLIATAIVSIMLNPMLYRSIPAIEAFLQRRPRIWRLLNRKRTVSAEDALVHRDTSSASHRAVLVGYGPIGQKVARLLRERGIEPTIIEMNIATHRNLRSAGQRVVYGDANQREVLEEAGIRTASSLILSASGSAKSTEAIRTAREINPRIHVVARADFLGETESMRIAGANEIFSGEGEVALAMTDSILRQLGATPEQLDEERARIRTELFQT